MRYLFPVLFFLLLAPIGAADPSTTTPTLSLALSGTDVNPNPTDPSGYTVSIVSGESATVTITATVTGGLPDQIKTVAVRKESLPTLFQGITASLGGAQEDNACDPAPATCTIPLVISTTKAEAGGSGFPDNTIGAKPGKYSFVLDAELPDGTRASVAITIKVTSGETSMILFVSGRVLLPGEKLTVTEQTQSFSLHARLPQR